ncbi:MAG: helix-turn-helix domain-containing protein [Deltaproteobacteria bacterium]|nr:helix-turn-helix domain-containing protein [Deltaproteobacteria bacterium]
MARPKSGFACHVKAYRLTKEWSQEELAEKVDVRRQAIYDIESGRYLPNTAIALRLARLFGCRVEDLFVEQAEKTIILMGCDPAFEILGQHISRLAPDARVHCRFASSHRALEGLAEGVAHVAGTHLHNTGSAESNVVTAGRKLAGVSGRVLGFSLLEEGLMVAKGNPLGVRTVADLARPMVRFVNREPGAALRVLLDDLLQRAGIPVDAVNGYRNQVTSHREGAYRIACNVADAALGLRAIAEAYGLGFVPITNVRCDLVIPNDLSRHPTIRILLDVLQSAALRREIDTLPGYDGSVTGKVIAELIPDSGHA